MSEYVLLCTTDRYQSIVDNGSVEKVADYQYYFFGKPKTVFMIYKIKDPQSRIIIRGKSEVFPDNSIPLKVFPKFDTTEEIVKEIYELDINEESKIVKL